jgi:plastocyanin
MRRRALAAVPVLAALALAGCGTSSATGSAAPATTAPTTAMPSMSMPATDPSTTAATTAPIGTTAVTIENFAFSPATLTVKAGATVTWTNKDQDPHTATARDKAFSSPTLNTGQSFSYTFKTPGSYAYLCTIHPFMTATVVVTP